MLRCRAAGDAEYGSNLHGDADAKKILQEWWSGAGPSADTWRFNLKAEANDAVGRSFPAHVPNEGGREDLLKRFVTDARAGRPTKVFVRGGLCTFNAPAQGIYLTGLYLELQSSGNIRLKPPEVE